MVALWYNSWLEMQETVIERLARAVDYPEDVPAGALSYAFVVDDSTVFGEAKGGRVRLSRLLTDDAEKFPALAQLAAGRMLAEDAVLACGRRTVDGAPGTGAFLWQDAPAGADSGELARLFETFMASCDWWRERLAVEGDSLNESPGGESFVIRP